MTQKHQIQLFEEKKVRSVWDDQEEKWYFSIVDVCAILTDQPDYDHARNYWKVLKFRLIKKGNESVTKCSQLKLASPKDGKRYKTDVADTERQNVANDSTDGLFCNSRHVYNNRYPDLAVWQKMHNFAGGIAI